MCFNTIPRAASLSALSPLEDGEEDNDDEDLVDGADCDCPIGISSIYQSQDLNTRSFLGTITCRHKAILFLECEETQYEEELSQADLRRDSVIFDRLKDTFKPLQNLLEKQKDRKEEDYVRQRSYYVSNSLMIRIFNLELLV